MRIVNYNMINLLINENCINSGEKKWHLNFLTNIQDNLNEPFFFYVTTKKENIKWICAHNDFTKEQISCIFNGQPKTICPIFINNDQNTFEIEKKGATIWKNFQQLQLKGDTDSNNKQTLSLIFDEDVNKEQYEYIIRGIILSSWHLDYKTDVKKNDLYMHVYSNINHEKQESIEKSIKIFIHAINFTKILCYAPANIIYPESFANAVKEYFRNNKKVDVTILNKQEIELLKMGALLSVAQGSQYDPRVVAIKIGKGKKVISFLGKGVTYDTGGLDLKLRNMAEMKYDMCGAGAVVGLIDLLSHDERILEEYTVYGLVGLVENNIGPTATRPSDIIKSMSGKTIEILNTDAEGRIVLADLMTYTQKFHKPDIIIDYATLTGAISVCLGSEYAGLFSNNEVLSKNLYNAGIESGDKVWPFPMGDEYNKTIENKNADIGNIAVNYNGAGSIKGGKFIEYFLENKNIMFAHIDIASTSHANASDPFCSAHHPTGFGIRLGLQFMKNWIHNVL